MALTLPPEARDEALASLQTYAAQHFAEPLGNLGAGALLDFILEEIGPSIYNRAIVDVQDRLLLRVREIDVELHQPEFTFWANPGRRR